MTIEKKSGLSAESPSQYSALYFLLSRLSRNSETGIFVTEGKVIEMPAMGGLHHRYERRAA
jgi:hypothetical protein